MRIGDTALLGDYESNGAGLKNERWIVKESMHAKQFKGELVVEMVKNSARRKDPNKNTKSADKQNMCLSYREYVQSVKQSAHNLGPLWNAMGPPLRAQGYVPELWATVECYANTNNNNCI